MKSNRPQIKEHGIMEPEEENVIRREHQNVLKFTVRKILIGFYLIDAGGDGSKSYWSNMVKCVYFRKIMLLLM